MPPEMVGSLDAVPQPTRATLDDGMRSVEFRVGDDLGVGAVARVDNNAVTRGAPVRVMDLRAAQAAHIPQLKLQQESETVVVDQHRGIQHGAAAGGVPGTADLRRFRSPQGDNLPADEAT